MIKRFTVFFFFTFHMLTIYLILYRINVFSIFFMCLCDIINLWISYSKKKTDVYIFVVDLFNFLSPRKNMEMNSLCIFVCIFKKTLKFSNLQMMITFWLIDWLINWSDHWFCAMIFFTLIESPCFFSFFFSSSCYIVIWAHRLMIINLFVNLSHIISFIH